MKDYMRWAPLESHPAAREETLSLGLGTTYLKWGTNSQRCSIL